VQYACQTLRAVTQVKEEKSVRRIPGDGIAAVLALGAPGSGKVCLATLGLSPAGENLRLGLLKRFVSRGFLRQVLRSNFPYSELHLCIPQRNSPFFNDGVDTAVIALWLGHESIETTHGYLEADLKLKERALQKLAPAAHAAPRFQADDPLMTFLKTL